MSPLATTVRAAMGVVESQQATRAAVVGVAMGVAAVLGPWYGSNDGSVGDGGGGRVLLFWRVLYKNLPYFSCTEFLRRFLHLLISAR